jgi:Mycobacterium membrane protein
MRRTLTATALLLTATACAPTNQPDGGIATPPPPAAGNPTASAPPAPATTPPPLPTKPAPTKLDLPDGTHTLVYRIGGTASSASSISYSTGDGQEQQTNVRVPWKRSLKVREPASVAITAQNGGSGSITCEIAVDGKTVKRSTSSGSYAVVTCVATIGF